MHVMIDSDLLLPLPSSTLLMFREFLPCQSDESVTTEREYVSLQAFTQTIRKVNPGRIRRKSMVGTGSLPALL